MSRARNAAELVGPVVLVAVVGLLGTLVTGARALEFIEALVFVSMVVALYVFVGNSGVLSFGQISFFIVGAYSAGELTLPADTKGDVLPNVFPLLRDHTIGNASSLVVVAAFMAVVLVFLPRGLTGVRELRLPRLPRLRRLMKRAAAQSR